MSIGLCVRYADPQRGEDYWPYLTQRHLRDALWPLARRLGLERIELLEAWSDYADQASVETLLTELRVVLTREAEPELATYAYRDHLLARTAELVARLERLLDTWVGVRSIDFF